MSFKEGIIHIENGYKFSIKDQIPDVNITINSLNYNLHFDKISKSVYFKIFLENKDNFKKEEIIITKINGDVAESHYILNVIKYLYYGKTYEIKEDVYEYFMLADFLQIDCLTNYLLKKINKKIKKYRCIDIKNQSSYIEIKNKNDILMINFDTKFIKSNNFDGRTKFKIMNGVAYFTGLKVKYSDDVIEKIIKISYDNQSSYNVADVNKKEYYLEVFLELICFVIKNIFNKYFDADYNKNSTYNRIKHIKNVFIENKCDCVIESVIQDKDCFQKFHNVDKKFKRNKKILNNVKKKKYDDELYFVNYDNKISLDFDYLKEIVNDCIKIKQEIDSKYKYTNNLDYNVLQLIRMKEYKRTDKSQETNIKYLKSLICHINIVNDKIYDLLSNEFYSNDEIIEIINEKYTD